MNTLSRPWRDSLGYIVTNGMTGVVVFSSLYLNNDTIFRTIAEQPNLYSIQATLLVSDWTMLSLGCWQRLAWAMSFGRPGMVVRPVGALAAGRTSPIA